MKTVQSKRGLTLIELILAMAIFSILVVAFMTVFTSSLTWVFNSGNKGIAYNQAQDEIEGEIANVVGIYTDDLVISFPDADYTIRSWQVKSDQTVGLVDSSIRTYVPQLPKIAINPAVLTEGDSTTQIEITGYNTNFNNQTYIDIFDANGLSQLDASIIAAAEDAATANFYMPGNVVLKNGNYIVRITTPLIDGGLEIARTKLSIEQPNFVVAGTNKIYISADGKDWITRSNFAGFPVAQNMVSVANSGSQYVLVSSDGQALYSQEKKPWVITGVTETLTDVVWSMSRENFYALSANGSLYASSTGDLWQLNTSLWADWPGLYKSITSTLLADGTSFLTAVGDTGAVYSSYDLASWSRNANTDIDAISWRAVTSGYYGLYPRVVAVGENGSVTTSDNGLSWSDPTLVASASGIMLNSVTYGQDRFVVVGDGGFIMTSTDSVNWTQRTSGSIENLHDVSFSHPPNYPAQFIATGDNGTLLRSDDGITWQQPDKLDNAAWTSPGEALMAVGGR